MADSGERLLIAATLDELRLGEEVRKIPVHMTVIGWFMMSDRQRYILGDVMDAQLQNSLFQQAVGGEQVMFGANEDIPARQILGVEDYPWVAFHALIQSVGQFPTNDEFAHHFAPHITDTETRAVGEGEHVVFPSIVMFARTDEDPMKRVQAAYQLNPGTAAYERET